MIADREMNSEPLRVASFLGQRFPGCGVFLLALALSVGSAFAGNFGLYRSTDGGRTWMTVGKGLPGGLRVDALGNAGHHRLAGTERGLYLSVDDGASWIRPRLGVPEDFKVWDFANLGARVYCATTHGVWSSGDHGQSWTPVGVRLAGTNVLSLAVSGGRLYAGTDLRGVHVLDAGGREWESVSQGLPPEAQVFQFAEQGGVLYAALYARGIHRLDSVTQSWTPAGNERPLRLVAVGDTLLSGRNPGGVYTSSDGGKSWNWAGLGLSEYAPTWAMARWGNTVLLGTSGGSGLLRSDNAGASWTASDWGLPAGGEAIAFGPAESSLLAVLILRQ